MVRYQDARRFVYSHARLLEWRLFETLFEGADPQGVVAALAGYRNADGGFGHGLEPDKRVPASQPLDVEIAFQTMDAAGAVDRAMVDAACDFLASIGDGVGWLIGSVDEYPHAPHWMGSGPPPGVNPTAGIVALLWKWGVDHPWRERATAFCWAEIDKGLPIDAHGFGEVLAFLAQVPDRVRADAAAAGLRAWLKELEWFLPEPAPDRYGVTPLHYAPRPDSPWTALFDPGAIDAHLDAMAAAQQDDGGWPITWDTLSPAAVIEYRGYETIRALRTLRAYGRLESP